MNRKHSVLQIFYLLDYVIYSTLCLSIIISIESHVDNTQGYDGTDRIILCILLQNLEYHQDIVRHLYFSLAKVFQNRFKLDFKNK